MGAYPRRTTGQPEGQLPHRVGVCIDLTDKGLLLSKREKSMEVLQSHQVAHEVTLFNRPLLGGRNNPSVAVQTPSAQSRNMRTAPMSGLMTQDAHNAAMDVEARLWEMKHAPNRETMIPSETRHMSPITRGHAKDTQLGK